jgi:hypothetical protein
MEKTKQDTILHAIQKTTSDTERIYLLTEYLGGLTKGLHDQLSVCQECQKENEQRFKMIESELLNINHILMGVNGKAQNGMRAQVKLNVKEIEKLEENLARWVTRITTTIALLNILLIPLLLYLIEKFLLP